MNANNKPSTVTGKVVRVIRHGHTYYGNPIMSITLDNGETYRITNNSGIVYAIENRDYRDAAHTFRLTHAGRIAGLAR